MGSHFGPNFDGFVRINMGCPRATLEEVMRRLTCAWQQYQSSVQN